MVDQVKKERKRKWTDEALVAEANKYKTRGEFLKFSASAYMTAKRLKVFDKITAHMTKAHEVWNEVSARKEAKKYTTRTAFFNGARGAYTYANSTGILEDIVSHMPRYAGKGKKRGPNIRTIRKTQDATE